MHGKLTANGALPRPALAGALTWETPKLGEVEAERVVVELATRRDVLYADGRIAGARARSAHRARRDSVDGAARPRVRSSGTPRRCSQISSPELPLGLVQDLLPARVQNVEGTGSLRIEIHGSPGEPRLDGELVIANASADLPALHDHFGPLDARIVLHRDGMRIEHFVLQSARRRERPAVGRDRPRTISSPARADLDARPARLRAALSGEPADAIVAGDVTVTGPIDALDIRGALELRALRYSLAGGSDPLLGEITVRDSRVAPSATPPAPDRDAPTSTTGPPST